MGFLLLGRPWLVVERLDGNDVAAMRMVYVRDDGSDGQFVPMFTDQHLAERFIENDPHLLGESVAFQPTTDGMLEAILLDCIECEEKISIDPEVPFVERNCYDAARVLEGFRRRESAPSD